MPVCQVFAGPIKIVLNLSDLRTALLPWRGDGHQELRHLHRGVVGGLQGGEAAGGLLHRVQRGGQWGLGAQQQQARQEHQVTGIHFTGLA